MKQVPDAIDLHGLTVEEAIARVDKFLNKAFRALLPRVWVIHGKGTGTLRSELRSYLGKHPLVARCSTADANRGGAGCTQVEIID